MHFERSLIIFVWGNLLDKTNINDKIFQNAFGNENSSLARDLIFPK